MKKEIVKFPDKWDFKEELKDTIVRYIIIGVIFMIGFICLGISFQIHYWCRWIYLIIGYFLILYPALEYWNKKLKDTKTKNER